MNVHVLVSLSVGLIVGHAVGLLAFMLYHRRGTRAVLLAALAFVALAGLFAALQAAVMGLPLLKWLEIQWLQFLVIALTATPMFVATVAFWNWRAKQQASKAADRQG